MGMPHAAERWTAEMVRALPDDGNRYELIEGQLIVTLAPRPLHQLALAALYNRLLPWLTATGLGSMLWSPADISLGEDELLQPDLFVYRHPFGQRPEHWSEITDLLLVVEALSPSTASVDRTLKRERYQRAGIPQYWLIDLDSRMIERWEPDNARPEQMFRELLWDPGTGVAPLRIDVANYFAEVLGVAEGG